MNGFELDRIWWVWVDLVGKAPYRDIFMVKYILYFIFYFSNLPKCKNRTIFRWSSCQHWLESWAQEVDYNQLDIHLHHIPLWIPLCNHYRLDIKYFYSKMTILSKNWRSDKVLKSIFCIHFKYSSQDCMFHTRHSRNLKYNVNYMLHQSSSFHHFSRFFEHSTIYTPLYTVITPKLG